MIIDHINGDRTDNRLRMLREITPSCNSQNIRWEHKRVTSRFPGVYWNRKDECWMCQVRKHKASNSNSYVKVKRGFKSEYEAFDWYVRTLKEMDRAVNTQTEVYKDYLRWKGEQQQVTLDVF